MDTRTEPAVQPPSDRVVVWVAVLERGRNSRDFGLIRRANEELSRLGVEIRFGGQRYGCCDGGGQVGDLGVADARRGDR